MADVLSMALRYLTTVRDSVQIRVELQAAGSGRPMIIAVGELQAQSAVT